MFQQSLLQTSRAASASRRRSTVLAITLQVLLVAAGVIIPRMYIEALPIASYAPPTHVSFGSPEITHPVPVNRGPENFRSSGPVFRPTNTSVIYKPDNSQSGGGPANDPTPTNLPFGVCTSPACIPGMPPTDFRPHPVVTPGPTPKPRMASVMNLGGLIYREQPVYPPMLVHARLEGTVTMHAIISTDGRITELNVIGIKGSPLFAKSALDAVSHWRYQPYVLDNQPVPVETQIIVNFILQH